MFFADPGELVEYVLVLGENDKTPAEERPVFFFRPLTQGEYMILAEEGVGLKELPEKEKDVASAKKFLALFTDRVDGWRNLKSQKGAEVTFSPEAKALIPVEVATQVGVAIFNGSAMSADEAGN